MTKHGQKPFLHLWEARFEAWEARFVAWEARFEAWGVWGRGHEWTNGQTDKRKSPCVLQDFVPFGAAAQKGASLGLGVSYIENNENPSIGLGDRICLSIIQHQQLLSRTYVCRQALWTISLLKTRNSYKNWWDSETTSNFWANATNLILLSQFV